MKIYTKVGDKGETSLFNGKKIPKFSLYTHTYGNLDELNSFLGLCLYSIPHSDPGFVSYIQRLQHLLFCLGTDLATPLDSKNKIDRISEQHILEIEKKIDLYQAKLPELKNFILPSGSLCSLYFHICRTVCRRAERFCSELQTKEKINEQAFIFLNRLSDFFFVCSRFVNLLEKSQEIHLDRSKINP